MVKVSIIVPVYNTQDYLEKCLNSILNQTNKDIEVLLVDNGSEDKSGFICDHYAENDSRVKVFHILHGSAGRARNVGLEYATGQYIAFVDSDDWIENDFIETLVHQITQGVGLGVVSCGYYKETDGKSISVENKKDVIEDIISPSQMMKYIYKRDDYRGVSGYIWNRLFDAKLFQLSGTGIRFPDDIIVGEDVVFLAECMLKTTWMQHNCCKLYHYVQHKESAMNSDVERLKFPGSCAAYQRVIELYEKNYVSSEIINLLKRFHSYHASVLLVKAYNAGLDIKIWRKEMKRYRKQYILLNLGNRAYLYRYFLLTVCPKFSIKNGWIKA